MKKIVGVRVKILNHVRSTVLRKLIVSGKIIPKNGKNMKNCHCSNINSFRHRKKMFAVNLEHNRVNMDSKFNKYQSGSCRRNGS